MGNMMWIKWLWCYGGAPPPCSCRRRSPCAAGMPGSAEPLQGNCGFGWLWENRFSVLPSTCSWRQGLRPMEGYFSHVGPWLLLFSSPIFLISSQNGLSRKKAITTTCILRLHHIKSKNATLTTGFTIQTTGTCWCSHSMDTCTSRRFTRYTSSAPTMRTLLTASVYKPLEPPVQSIKMQFTSSTWNMNCRVWKEEGNKCEAQLFQVKRK